LLKARFEVEDRAHASSQSVAKELALGESS
jgi:hypothetical protein